MNYLTEVLVLSVVRNARSFHHIAVCCCRCCVKQQLLQRLQMHSQPAVWDICIVHRPSDSLLLIRKPGRLLFTFHFIQPAIRVVRMLCCMRYVALATKASMTVTLKSLKIRGLKHNIYIKPHLVDQCVSYQDLTHDMYHIKIGSPSGNINN